MRVDIVIPVYNEEHVLESCVGRLRSFLQKNLSYPWQILIADNASRDRTLEVAKRLADEYDDVAYIHLSEKGRGRALRRAWSESKAEIVCYMDVDLSTSLDHILELVDSLVGGYDLATGSRLLKGARIKRCLKREFLSRVYNHFIKLILRTRFSDAQCGFKGGKTAALCELLPQVKNNEWFFDTELLVLAEKCGYRIKDIPVIWEEDSDSRVNILKTVWEDIQGVMELHMRLRKKRIATRSKRNQMLLSESDFHLSAGYFSLSSDGDNRIVFINPNWNEGEQRRGPVYNRFFTPLSLAYCAALLEQDGFSVRVIDANVQALSLQEIREHAKGGEKIFVTSSTLDKWVCPDLELRPFYDTVKALRADGKEVYALGIHGTVRPEAVLQMSGATALIRGEPELAVRDICRGKEYAEIGGLVYEVDKKPVVNPLAEFVDLDVIPLPAFHLLPMESYRYEVLGHNFALLEGSRGCPYSCIFCLRSMFGRKYRKKSPERLCTEIDYAVERFGVRTAYFMDLEFTLNRPLVEKVCHHLIRRGNGFSWCCQTRADSVDRSLLHLMKKSGCKLIHYGVETGSSRVMGLINKRINREKIMQGVALTKEAGIKTACFFMFGFPTETIGEMEETCLFARQLNPSYASFHIAIPYPGTDFHQQVAVEQGDNELFPEAHTGSYSLGTLKSVQRRALYNFYLRPQYLLGRLKQRDFKTLWDQFKVFRSYVN